MASTTAASVAAAVNPRSLYHQAPTKYRDIVIPELLGDASAPLPFEESELWSQGASTSERFHPTDSPAREARQASGAHDPDQGVGQDESGYTVGATGVWAIAGPMT